MNLKTKFYNFIFYSVLFKILPRKTKFKLIYQFNLWGSAESVSGPGSETVATSGIDLFFRSIFNRYQIGTIIDLPCGDFNWMKSVDLTEVNYIGCDIIKDLIRTNSAKYSNEKIKFIELDILKDALPNGDLILIKDLFIHFSLSNIQIALTRLKASNIKYVLTTNFPDSENNILIKDGYNFNINFQKPPFNFAKSLEVFQEEILHDKKIFKTLELWRITDIPTFNDGH